MDICKAPLICVDENEQREIELKEWLWKLTRVQVCKWNTCFIVQPFPQSFLSTLVIDLWLLHDNITSPRLPQQSQLHLTSFNVYSSHYICWLVKLSRAVIVMCLPISPLTSQTLAAQQIGDLLFFIPIPLYESLQKTDLMVSMLLSDLTQILQSNLSSVMFSSFLAFITASTFSLTDLCTASFNPR